MGTHMMTTTDEAHAEDALRHLRRAIGAARMIDGGTDGRRLAAASAVDEMEAAARTVDELLREMRDETRGAGL